MAIEVTQLSTLDPAKVRQNLEQVVTRLQEFNPTLDLKRGVFHDLLALLHASLSTAEQESLNRYLQARSLLDIEADPTLADDGIVDGVLSNFGVTRKSGSTATGEVTIVVTALSTVTIASGAIFEADGKVFTADSVFTAKREAGQINTATDRLLTDIGGGQYAFTISVTAEEEGTASQLTKDTLLVPAEPPRNFLTAYAASDFRDGRLAETNQEMLARLQQGIAAKAPSNRINMEAMLRAHDAFSRVVATSIIGYGDSEMIRDRHTIFPVAHGGRVDWYIRSEERVRRDALTIEAVLISVNGTSGTWQFAIDRDRAPGFYEVASVRLPAAENVLGTFEILSDTRSVDLTGDGFIPDIETVAEGAYSRFQTAVIKFVDNESDYTAISVGDKQDYAVEVKQLPLIAEIQDHLSAFDNRSYGADILVKAPVPCFVQLSFVIAKQRTQANPDLDAIKASLAAEVNNSGFVGRLYASHLHDVIHSHLSGRTSVGAIDMFGRLRYSDGTTHYVRSSEVLVIEDVDGAMVSPRTVQFFCEPDDISITVSTEVPVPV
jgi:hypothetical protein